MKINKDEFNLYQRSLDFIVYLLLQLPVDEEPTSNNIGDAVVCSLKEELFPHLLKEIAEGTETADFVAQLIRHEFAARGTSGLSKDDYLDRLRQHVNLWYPQVFDFIKENIEEAIK